MVWLQKQFPPMDNELVIILIKFDGPITSEMFTMFKKVILLPFTRKYVKTVFFTKSAHIIMIMSPVMLNGGSKCLSSCWEYI